MPTNSLYCKHSRPKDTFLKVLINLAAGITVVVLVGILGYILVNGVPYITWQFISTPYSEMNPDQKGILPMIINTLYIVVITLLIAVPIGISSAIYLTQYAKQGRLVRSIRFTTEVLSGIPSIIFGLFGYTVFCILFRLQVSILAGCLTTVSYTHLRYRISRKWGMRFTHITTGRLRASKKGMRFRSFHMDKAYSFYSVKIAS